VGRLDHEEGLLALLEKIGQPGAADSPPFPAVEDADSNADHTETRPPPESTFQESPAPPGPGISKAPISKKNLFVHHDTHPVVYDVLLLKQYDLDWYQWTPETLWRMIMQDFHVPSISDHAKNKIQAIRTLHINEWFWSTWEIFGWVAQALNNNIPDFQIMQKASLPQMFAAIDMATMIRDDEVFSTELQGYIAASMVDEGVFYAPHPVEFCQDEIEGLLKSLKADEAQGTIGAVADKWRDSLGKALETVVLAETPVDVQVAKLLVARSYLDLRRGQMKDQLRLLVHGS